MTKVKCLGIWMDHASANLIDCTDPVETKTIESAFTQKVKEDVLDKGEKATHNKAQQLLSAFYKKLGEAIKKYEEVILFGPTNAKVELFNSLRTDLHFAKIKIEIKQADKMTENQQHAFVRTIFQNHN